MASSEGIGIFISGVPKQIQESQLIKYLDPYLKGYGITIYELNKGKNQGYAFLEVKSRSQGETFLIAVQMRTDLRLSPRFPMKFRANKQQDGGAKARDQKFAEEKMAQLESSMSTTKITVPDPTVMAKNIFNTTTLSCGAWAFQDSASVFIPYYSRSKPGRLLIGKKYLVALFDREHWPGQWERRIDFEYDNINAIFTTGGNNPSIIINCFYSPRFYVPDSSIPLFEILYGTRRGAQPKKIRVPSFSPDHGEVAQSCFSYELVLCDDRSLRSLRDILQSGPDMPSVSHVRVRYVKPSKTFADEMNGLRKTLAIKWKWKDRPASPLPFSICFQILKLAMNGKLPPALVSGLARKLTVLVSEGVTDAACADAVRRLYFNLERIIPLHSAEDYSLEKLFAAVKTYIDSSFEGPSMYQTVKDHHHLQLVHHVRVTPSGIYLEGPAFEVSNRVLRKHATNSEYFTRVTFSEEDGQRIEFQFNTNMDRIYTRIQNVLDSSIMICNRNFQFLGFSQSSMKSQTAWFMAPFFDATKMQLLMASHVVDNIGDFSSFRSPAKCAARIGQAFTDTNGFVTIQAGTTKPINDIERNGRIFSDGCATVSPRLAEEIADQFPRLSMRVKPVVFQIRYQGVKGVLSVDPGLSGKTLCTRQSMWKFGTQDTHDLEICGMADKPRPLFLNRPLIKVLEDLGVPPHNILELAEESLLELRQIASSVVNIASFLERERIGEAAGLSGLVRRINDIGIDVQEDQFLSRVIEMAAMVHLRDLKYKGRIRVENGVKLIGIMDETGFLKEGEIYCPWINPEGRRVSFEGMVAITRSPTNHPGDVQIVRAVEVPDNSNLRELYNCVAFSQHGTRDLPSQLGGGDLDGDLYDVFWDHRLIPPTVHPPADYPRAPAVNIGRRIVTTDITAHFVDYMKTDAVGLLSSQLLWLSDRLDAGTKDSQCIQISKLISDALDFPKTGIKPDMSKMPRIDKSLKPDFMAPSPHVKIESFDASLKFLGEEEKNPHDPVASLDLDARKTHFYKSDKVLGQLYRKVDEKSFYESLQEYSRQHIRIKGEKSSTLECLLAYVIKATQGLQYEQYLELAREIRHTYEHNVEDASYNYALHSSHPLHEVEVVTGCALGSVFNRRLRDSVTGMREQYSRDVAYARLRIRLDDDEDEREALPRSIACLSVAVKEPGKKVSHDDVLKSFAYVAAAVCLEELERFHQGLLPLSKQDKGSLLLR